MRERICKISLFTAILASITTLPVDARVNVNNSSRSYADAYNQVNAIRYQQEYMAQTAAAAVDNLPVMVSDEKLASEIANNTSETTVADLDACAMIWPNGSFKWDIPESGIRHNQINQCVAVVSLVNGNTNEVLATTTVAAGDSIKCNIDYFPESGMNKTIVENTELPADTKPTIEEVEAVMNAEQRQNAGLKIAAGAIIAGAAGNLLSKKEAGDTKMFGYTNTRLRDTAIGMVTGAGVMAASSYSGKVAGDTINSAAVNAASGMIVGNMLAGANGGDGYLEIKKCTIDDGDYKGVHDCIAGQIKEKGDKICTKPSTGDGCKNTTESNKIYLVNKNGNVKQCDQGQEDNELENCVSYEKLIDVQLVYKNTSKISFNSVFSVNKKDTKNSEFEYLDIYYYTPEDGDAVLKKFEQTGLNSTADTAYYKIVYGHKVKGTKSAYIVFKDDVKQNIQGYKKSELSDLTTDTEFEYFNRNSNDSIGEKIDKNENQTFDALSKDAEDGGLIDISNRARTGGTLVGTATGGAMGGFAGYQGAKTEITNRWTAAVREYEDSLSNFACTSGTRYLGKYNDYVDVPELKKTEEENK